MARLPVNSSRRLRTGSDVQPRLSRADGLQKLKRQLERMTELRKLPWNDPRHQAWTESTRDLINDTFGNSAGADNERASDFAYGGIGASHPRMSYDERARWHSDRLDYQEARLKSIIEQVEDSTPAPSTPVPAPTGQERWKQVGELGFGGQGRVFLVMDQQGVEVPPVALREAITRLTAGLLPPDAQQAAFESARELIERIARSVDPARRAAKKVLHEPKDARKPESAAERLRREIGAMREVQHPNLLRIIDADPDSNWYVSEYHERGPLSKDPERFRGDVGAALRALRPLVQGVAELHTKGFVHRDVKPENIFVASDGRLVLGDFGLILLPMHTRLSETLENVGSRDWMPPWAHTMLVEEIRPDFDVFGIGKTLWSMVSGKPLLPFWYFQRKGFNVEEFFPQNADMRHVNALLAKCVVEEQSACIPNASALLREIDATLRAMAVGAGPGGIRMACGVCGRGDYQLIAGHTPASLTNFGLNPHGAPEFRIYACKNCGHVQLHHRSGNFKPDSWPDEGSSP